MADSARARRLAKRIVAIVATELEHQVKDPRLAMVTVTAATVTPDLRDAVVFYTVYGDELDQVSSAAALASATGVIRSAVGRQTGIKFTPTLAFKPDVVPAVSRKMEELIEAARLSDAEVAERAAGASYAGESDPYRAPKETEEDGSELAEDAAADAADTTANGTADAAVEVAAPTAADATANGTRSETADGHPAAQRAAEAP